MASVLDSSADVDDGWCPQPSRREPQPPEERNLSLRSDRQRGCWSISSAPQLGERAWTGVWAASMTVSSCSVADDEHIESRGTTEAPAGEEDVTWASLGRGTHIYVTQVAVGFF